MPYQGPNGYQPYVPPPHLNYGSRGMEQNGQAHVYHTPGQAAYSQQNHISIPGPPPRQQQQPHQHQHQHQHQYQAPQIYSQPAYSTPQYYGQNQPTSFYQSPSPSVQLQQRPQQPYLSPPAQHNTIQNYGSYSPDPLQDSHPPPQSYRGAQTHQPPQQYRSSQPAYPPSPRQPVPSPQWSSYPTSTNARQDSSSRAARNSHVPLQHPPPPPPPPPPSQQQQRPSPQQRPQSISGRPASTQVQAPSSKSQQRPSSQQHHSSNQSRPSPSRPQQPKTQSSSRQLSSNPPQIQAQRSTPQQVSRSGTDSSNVQTSRHDYRYQNVDADVGQRRTAHVQLPVHRTQTSSEDESMARSNKRRRSNEGRPVPVDESALQSQQRPHAAPSVTNPIPSAPKPTPSSQAQPASRPATIDYQATLLALSDEYISAAYSMTGALATAEVSDETLDEYHALLSTGMGCLDSVIRNYHIPDPRKEARIRLRLASLLYEETDNDMETEEILSKGITICERARLIDLKYAMHHLLARVWFKGDNARAATKTVDKLIVEVEKLNLRHWIYAFRFLRVSLGLQVEATHAESSAIVKHLQAIQDIGSRNYHVTVQIVASALESLVHLRTRTPESVDLAQRAMAAARTHQLTPEMDSMPQIKALLNCVDLACNLQNFNPEQAGAKTQVMQKHLDASSRDVAWRKDGIWQVPLCAKPSSSGDIDADTGGLLKDDGMGAYTLSFIWLTHTQLFTLGFLLSGLASLHQNASHEQKAEEFLREGIKMSNHQIDAVPQSMTAASAQHYQQRLMRLILRLYGAFGRCGRADFEFAWRGVESIRKEVQELEFGLSDEILCLVTYLEAVCKHGLGNLQGALKIYRSDELSLNPSESRLVTSTTNPIKVLAVLNSIPIMRFNGDIDDSERLLTTVQDYCLTRTNSNGNLYGNKALESAFYALKATEPPDVSTENVVIMKTKQYLQCAVQAAKVALNHQLLCIVMNQMTNMFFKNIVGDQAEKSVRAGRTLARKSQNKLWMAVADRMYSKTLERCGKLDEAAAARHSAQEAMQALPESLKAAVLLDGMADTRMSEI
ncbi:uncharacterized protein RCC_04929 [Lecanosticta acicola]|uniref:Uncharacterized protein RCC_04929 n=1 Tax=Lecanosticta acicola TaxID=111012 RepID=A0AAI8YX90_9PEZI|nr:uncharacterized protein RCC_04929 [Lecanosticta acicola]